MTLETQILSILSSRSYFLLFIILLVEGPIIGFIASHLASLGFLNIFLVLIVYFLGDFVGDVLHYLFGLLLVKTHNHFLKDKFKKLSNLFKSKNINSINKLVENNLFLSLVVIKLTPPISSLGLISLGVRKTNFVRFIKNTAIVCLMIEIPIVFLGYFTGLTAEVFLKSRTIYERLTFFLLVLVICIYLLHLLRNYISKKIISKKKIKL